MATSTSTYLNRKTPGVYITEIDAFGTSVVGVATAVPIFIGYTETAIDPATSASLHNVSVLISSMADYQSYFGGAAPTAFTVAPATTAAGCVVSASDAATRFDLYWQMQLFFANGGGACYVVSCGGYGAPAIAASDLQAGLTAAGYAVGPTIIVIPEACQLSVSDGSYAKVVQEMLEQAGTLQDRVAILDLPGCRGADSLAALQKAQQQLWDATAPAISSASYAAAYAPALVTTIVSASDVPYSDFVAADGDNRAISALMNAEAAAFYGAIPAKLAAIQSAIAALFPTPTTAGNSITAQPAAAIDTMLMAALPLYQAIKQQAAQLMNIAAPSGAMAGIWAKSDAQNGVWNAPANIAVSAVSGPLYVMNDIEQASFNLPVNGQAIDIIRSQPGRGTVVWGARTLDGNSLDYRYIQVRRTLIYIEQSIKQALRGYVFAANDATTWATVTSSIEAFLTGLWQQGGLMGDKASDAFSVSCGLGSTMTAQNILDGYMMVAVTVQIIHPAEFIALTFRQQMGG
ncbi:MAG: hypothetical protein BVN33_03570 [Proteobacteria bacterium ST_bin13]|nr:MAG: hypothetical protein BVN33_03570 [Proteobacteria bacterium ST_bin13]